MEKIQELLQKVIDNNTNFNRDGRYRKIVFWFNNVGDEAESLESVEKIELKNAEVLVYDNNSFYLRHYIETEKPKDNFVIFFPDGKQNIYDNPLLDLYVKNMDLEFSLDKPAQIISDFNLDNDLRPAIEKNYKFFKSSKRVEGLKKFDVELSKENIEYMITASLLGIKSIQVEEIIKGLFIAYKSNSKEYIELTKCGNEEFVMYLLNDYFGSDLKSYPEIGQLMNCIMITYFESNTFIDNANMFNSFLLKKRNNINFFVDQMMRDDKSKELFNDVSSKAEIEFGITQIIEEHEIDSFIDCDGFKVIDDYIINYVIDKLNNNLKEYEIYNKYISIRESKYWGKCLVHEYKFLKKIISFYQKSNEFIPLIKEMDIDSFAKLYAEKLYKLDNLYRKISFNYNHIANKENFDRLKDFVEKIYNKLYIESLSINWSSSLENMKSHSDTKIPLQRKFYFKYVEPYTAKKGRTIVVISDAMRYEVAKELNIKLRDISTDTKVEYMWGNVPSYTKLGMATLLPNSELKRDKNEIDIIVDGMKSSSIDDRERILINKQEDSVAIQYLKFKTMKKAQWQKMFSGKKVIYIYHDQIDKTGESDEENVFNACQTTIDELYGLVDDLHTTFGGINLFITADHGFFYKNGTIEKFSIIEKGEESSVAKLRFEYSKNKVNKEGILSISTDYLFGEDSGYVNIPKGEIIYSRQGGGRNYVHGGALPQEIIIPVINFKSSRNNNSEVENVEIVYSGNSNRISNIISYLTFIQAQKVDEIHKAARYLVRFEDEDGNKISDETTIIADYKDDVVRNRVFKEKFVFKSMKYDETKKYYLVIENESTGKQQKSEFVIDILEK